MANNNITTARTVISEIWKKKGIPYRMHTRPYRSVAAFVLTLVETKLDTNGKASFGLYRIEKGQRVEWFAQGLSDEHPVFGQLTEADTNQLKGYNTNGGEDVAIEGISASCRTAQCQFSVATLGNVGVHITNQNVYDLLKDGSGVVADPGCLLTPPQLASPFNLENSIFEAIGPHVSLKIEFNRSNTDYLTELGNIPEGVGRSYLKTHGEPTTNNRFRIPEGIRWMGEKGGDSEMIIRGEVTKEILIPLNAVANVAFVDPILPSRVILPVQMRLHGAVFCFLSKN